LRWERGEPWRAGLELRGVEEAVAVAVELEEAVLAVKLAGLTQNSQVDPAV
jgi:hypothetical protein